MPEELCALDDVSRTVTQLLYAWREGDANALDRLTPLDYDELRRLARAQMKREGHTLQPTALAREAYARPIGAELEWRWPAPVRRSAPTGYKRRCCCRTCCS